MYKLRFGAEIHRMMVSSDWFATIREIEAWGYSSVCVPDHFYTDLAVIPALAAAGAATSTLALCSHVLCNTFRHPLVLAKEAATIDLISGGRLELGIGTGWHAAEHETTGIALPSPSERLVLLEESISIIKAAFTGKPFSFTGNYFTIRNHAGRPLPARSGGPLILIGGGSRKVLSMAAEVADIVSVNFALRSGAVNPDSFASGDLETTRQKLRWIEQAASNVSRMPEISVRVNNTILTDDRENALAELAAATGVSAEILAESPHVLCGNLRQIRDDIVFRRDELGISYFVISDDGYRDIRTIVEDLAEV